jgi:hypothetical protein
MPVTSVAVPASQAQALDGVQLGYFSDGRSGRGSWGLYAGTLPKALSAAFACLIAFAVFSYVLVLIAGAHASVARMLLSPPHDPLAQAEDLPGRPGPLPSLLSSSRTTGGISPAREGPAPWRDDETVDHTT